MPARPLRSLSALPRRVGPIALLLLVPAAAPILSAPPTTSESVPPGASAGPDRSTTSADTVSPVDGGAAGPDAAAEAPPPPEGGGLRVFVDPATGELTTRPRPEQVRALEALERARLASRARAGEPEPRIRLFAIPGGVGADLAGRFLSSTILRVRPDGSFETLCVDHPEAGADHDHATPRRDAAPPLQDR